MRHLLWLSADYSSLSKLKCCTKEHLAKESHKSSCFRSQPETCSFRTVSSCGCDSIMLTDCNTSQMTQNFRSTSLPFLHIYMLTMCVSFLPNTKSQKIIPTTIYFPAWLLFLPPCISFKLEKEPPTLNIVHKTNNTNWVREKEKELGRSCRSASVRTSTVVRLKQLKWYAGIWKGNSVTIETYFNDWISFHPWFTALVQWALKLLSSELWLHLLRQETD